MTCRLCGAPLARSFVDLGVMPLANALIPPERAGAPEPRYRLHARVCDSCFLVQVDPVVPPQAIFGDYAYFSSVSAGWVEHARRFAEAAIGRLGLGPHAQVIEVASNDGYLLRHFVARGIPVLGIEPAANVAAAARTAGVPTEVAFFGRALAEGLRARADLLVANNVLAHVPDLNDFVAGLALALKPGGMLSIEVPHLLNLIREVQFDTIYHEHFSYFSLGTALQALARHGLAAVDVERLPTHGGSLRLWARHAPAAPAPSVAAILAAEAEAKLGTAAGYAGFAARVEAVCRDLLAFLDAARREGRKVVAYGAAAKGATLLNRCGVGPERIVFAVDRSPYKQGRLMPGSRLAIHPPGRALAERPDFLLILPWNLRAEIMREMAAIRDWGGRFVTAIPRLEIVA